MALEGWYYLHTNGDMIYKRDLDGMVADFRESDFVRHFWPVDLTDRACGWTIAIEAMALGANPARLTELIGKWGLTDEDAEEYAKRAPCRIYKDGNAWCATRIDFVNLQESPSGFGDTKIEAMAELSKALGFRAQKMWGSSFADLLKLNLPVQEQST